MFMKNPAKAKSLLKLMQNMGLKISNEQHISPAIEACFRAHSFHLLDDVLAYALL